MDLIVDFAGVPLWSPPAEFGFPAAVGMRDLVPLPTRMVWATLSRRYEPSHPPGEQCLFGMDFSLLLPMGVGLVSAELQIFNNTFLSPDVSKDWIIDPVTISGRQVWTRLAGGVEGNDYRLRWNVSDSDYNVYPRTALVLCSRTE